MAAILFVAYHFAPENTSGTHRSLHFARALVDAGHDVSVIAGPEPSPARSDPGLNRVFPWLERVHRVARPTSMGSLYVQWRGRLGIHSRPRAAGGPAPSAPQKKNGAAPGVVSRLRHHVRVWEALPDHQRSWIVPAVRLGRELGRRMGADAVFASGPPWTGVMAGHRMAERLGVPFIADFRDPWTAGSGASWRYDTEWAQRRAERWEAEVLRDAAVVCFNSPRLAAATTALSGLDARARVILNGSDVPRRATTAPIPRSSRLSIRHFGSLYAGRSVWPLVHCLDALIADGLVGADEIELELIGEMEASGEERTRLRSTRVPVRFTPHLRFSDAIARMSEPGVLLCVQIEMHADLIPTKLFDYLCTGNPILIMSPRASASWDLTSGFGRCRHLDLEANDHGRGALLELIGTWRRGSLRQERSTEDTESLRKERLGQQFAKVVESVVGGPVPAGVV